MHRDFSALLRRQEQDNSKYPLTLWQEPTEKQTARDKQSYGVSVINMLPPIVVMTL